MGAIVSSQKKFLQRRTKNANHNDRNDHTDHLASSCASSSSANNNKENKKINKFLLKNQNKQKNKAANSRHLASKHENEAVDPGGGQGGGQGDGQDGGQGGGSVQSGSSKKYERRRQNSNYGHNSLRRCRNNDKSEDKNNKLDAVPLLRRPTIVLPRPLWQGQSFDVVDFHCGIDDKDTSLVEKNSVLKYKTPHFRAYAKVQVPPVKEGKQLIVGWIQVVRSMTFVNLYGEHGITSWEFPEITTGKQRMISDSDGHRYPWYGARKEVAGVKGPKSTPTLVSVSMNDNFSPQVTWHIPAPNPKKAPRDARLTRVYRQQTFTTCLAVMEVDADDSVGCNGGGRNSGGGNGGGRNSVGGVVSNISDDIENDEARKSDTTTQTTSAATSAAAPMVAAFSTTKIINNNNNIPARELCNPLPTATDFVVVATTTATTSNRCPTIFSNAVNSDLVTSFRSFTTTNSQLQRNKNDNRKLSNDKVTKTQHTTTSSSKPYLFSSQTSLPTPTALTIISQRRNNKSVYSSEPKIFKQHNQLHGISNQQNIGVKKLQIQLLQQHDDKLISHKNNAIFVANKFKQQPQQQQHRQIISNNSSIENLKLMQPSLWLSSSLSSSSLSPTKMPSQAKRTPSSPLPQPSALSSSSSPPPSSSSSSPPSSSSSPPSSSSSSSSPASQIMILKAVDWSMEVEIAVQPTQPIGSRARLLHRPSSNHSKPEVIEGDDRLNNIIDSSALFPPNANRSQVLVWRPFSTSATSSGTSNSPPITTLPSTTNTKPSIANDLHRHHGEHHRSKPTLLSLAHCSPSSPPPPPMSSSPPQRPSLLSPPPPPPPSTQDHPTTPQPYLAPFPTIVVKPNLTTVDMTTYFELTSHLNESLFDAVVF